MRRACDKLASSRIINKPTIFEVPQPRIQSCRDRGRVQPLPLAVEFRHRSWCRDSVFAGLEQRGITLVSVDAPALPDLFPPLAIVTNPALFYLRLHGRNQAGWRSGSKQQQFDYDYTTAELEQWSRERIPSMRALCGRGVILFNNHVAGQAVRNARTMDDLLR